MKVLIAATCIAVLAAVGYYFFGEYREAEHARAAQALADQRARAEMEAELKSAEDALIADCKTRFPSQSTENLKALYQQCLDRHGVN
ncbi:hypothetical protein ASD64_08930 [Mesorhizobium sp. Root157]|uniref:hypothetical protein n=1 Tax=Mesorhizobium sp. Root157 TaxID=1736477 RepID=UPI0006F939B0|nr:hypothetical protein [Mesorhizobium sp. Root157]KQZ81873.1 hypothetical protein ASD64_08930 [Mesorhizobium sp. Root157]